MTKDIIPEGAYYAASEPEYIGEMGVRIELFSEPFLQPGATPPKGHLMEVELGATVCLDAEMTKPADLGMADEETPIYSLALFGVVEMRLRGRPEGNKALLVSVTGGCIAYAYYDERKPERGWVVDTHYDRSLIAASEDKVTPRCPNCEAELVEQKCKLICPRPGCGYRITCSE